MLSTSQEGNHSHLNSGPLRSSGWKQLNVHRRRRVLRVRSSLLTTGADGQQGMGRDRRTSLKHKESIDISRICIPLTCIISEEY